MGGNTAEALTAAVVVSGAATAAQAREKVTISDLSWAGAGAIGHSYARIGEICGLRMYG